MFILFHLIFVGMNSIFAGSCDASGNRDGVGMKASFNLPYSIVIDQQTGTLFVSYINNHNVRKITPQGDTFSFFSLPS
jgi:hypothetical protein